MKKTASTPGPRREAAEFVLPGHPDKLCDAAVDAVVDDVRRWDRVGQCGLEAACIFDRVMVTGRIAVRDVRVAERLQAGGLYRLVRAAYASAGYGEDAAGHVWGPKPEDLKVASWKAELVRAGRFEAGEAELRHLSDDQAICVGHAVRSPATNWLPPAHWLARRIGRELHRLRLEKGAGHVGPDGKVIVHGERSGGAETFRPRLVSLSLHHHEKSDWMLLRSIAEEAVETACAGWALPEVAMNGAGSFVCGGPNGDNGLSGKKLVVDAYGPGVPIGGGAWSGKDFFKVDRLGGMAARRVALESLLASDAEEATVTLSYLPGGDRPARVDLLLDGAPSAAVAVPRSFGKLESERLHRLFGKAEMELAELARWGHQVEGVPWELPARRRKAESVSAPGGAGACMTARPPPSTHPTQQAPPAKRTSARRPPATGSAAAP
jgi:S-adenosylmethionine synthetase